MGITSTIIKQQDGFTLIDAAIALMLIGILVAPLVQTYHTWQRTADRDTTQGNLRIADDAIRDFYFNNQRYPCPADPTLNPTNANYGQEDCSGTNANIASAPVVDIDGDGTVDNVWIGAVPFQSLKMTPSEALDAWRNKLVYAVSDIQTNMATFNAGFGIITINQTNTMSIAVPGADQSCSNPPVPTSTTNIHYALFSNGPQGVGGFTDDGIQAQACAAGPAGTADSENCDNDAVFLVPTCVDSQVAGAGQYDDIFHADNLSKTNVPTKLWDSGADPNNVGAASGYIGIGNPDPQAELDVIGNIRAERSDEVEAKLGQAHASEFCDTSGSRCFKTEALAGTDPKMRCDSTEGMTGIGSSRAKCGTGLADIGSMTCPDGEYISGIDAEGNVTCSPPP